MLKKILLALIFVITAITNVAHAESDLKTVASKAYVDTKIETKQLKIPAAGQPNVSAGETVMTYTAAGNGQIGERGLYSDISSYDATTDGDKLITASALNATFTNLPTTPTTKLECANQADGCTLWTIVDQTAYAEIINLPAGYTRLQYIESTGTQYIDTGINGVADLSVDFVAQGTGDKGVIVSFDQDYSGAFVGDNGTNFRGPSIFTDTSSLQKTKITSSWETNDLKLKQTTTINGIAKTYDNYSRTPGRINIFKGSSWSTADSFWVGKIYSFSIIRNGDLIRNFIPAKNSSDVIGMYDTVSGTFFTNAATSGPDFTAGPPAN